MSYNNYFDEVYPVGENHFDNQEDSSGNGSDRYQRRGRRQEFHVTVSDPSIQRNALDLISDHDKLGNSSVLFQTPVPPLFPDRETIPTTGTVPFYVQVQQMNQASSVKSRPMQTTAPETMSDKFLAICTAFLANYQQSAWRKLNLKDISNYCISPNCLTICIS
jgi:hypothetical protein